MEILYQINSLNELNKIAGSEDVMIRWLKMPDDYDLFCGHLRERNPDGEFQLDDWMKCQEKGTPYCGLIKNGKMIARAAAEKYLEDKWETAGVRVWASERGNGYAKQICWFVTKFILENNKIATCRTEEHNIAMQRVISSLGFQKIGFVST
ncbi:MAG: GNAT family N-acetyltransferase [Oscillospiraceae bacterium]|nr:GNAT family N-acetyltransferase [Oscillospiraceae bacterium]